MPNTAPRPSGKSRIYGSSQIAREVSETLEKRSGVISPKSKLFLICFFFGPFGGHRFFVGKWKTGLLMLVSLGGLGLWYFLDLVMIAAGKFTNPNPSVSSGQVVGSFLSEKPEVSSNEISPEPSERDTSETGPSREFKATGNSNRNDNYELDDAEDRKRQKPTRGSLSFFEMLHYFFTDSRVIKRLKSQHYQLSREINYALEAMRIYENDILPFLEPSLYDSKEEKGMVSFDGCQLIEVRKGARVSIRNSTYSSSSSGGSVGVGRVRVGGSSSHGSSSSRSVSYPAPDVLQVIDQGKLLLTSKKISFVGSKFTKTTEFKKLLDFQVDGLQILLAPSTGTKIWICEFPLIEWQWLVSTLLEAACESENRTLDSMTKTVYGTADNLLRGVNSKKLMEIGLAIENFRNELSVIMEQYALYESIYMNRVQGFQSLPDV